jgi:hypothetical protein
MQAKGPLPHSQEPATCTYPKPDQSNLRTHSISWRSILILSSRSQILLGV